MRGNKILWQTGFPEFMDIPITVPPVSGRYLVSKPVIVLYRDTEGGGYLLGYAKCYKSVEGDDPKWKISHYSDPSLNVMGDDEFEVLEWTYTYPVAFQIPGE